MKADDLLSRKPAEFHHHAAEVPKHITEAQILKSDKKMLAEGLRTVDRHAGKKKERMDAILEKYTLVAAAEIAAKKIAAEHGNQKRALARQIQLELNELRPQEAKFKPIERKGEKADRQRALDQLVRKRAAQGLPVHGEKAAKVRKVDSALADLRARREAKGLPSKK